MKFLLSNFFSPHGRASRGRFYLSMFFLLVLAGIIIPQGENIWSPDRSIVVNSLCISALLFVLTLVVIQTVKRLHDTGRPGKDVVFLVVPFINMYYFCVVWLFDGDPRDNKYGKDPKSRNEPLTNVP
jgi:uncharacterized membrane protein YhaH (DUF805 family)